jgi:hypothetical protein
MPVDVEVSHVPMHPLPHPIRQPPHGKNVASAVKDERVGLVQALARQDFVFNREKPRIVSLKCVRASHQIDLTAEAEKDPFGGLTG